MRVLIIYDHVADDAAPDQADALVQARAISAALETLGHEWMTLGATLDLDAARNAIEHMQPDVAFNLVESLGGNARLIHAVPALLDAMSIPYTGATADAQFITSHKPLAKRLMRAADISTPQAMTLDELRRSVDAGETDCFVVDRWIVKSIWEHASVGLDRNSVIETDDPECLLREMLRRMDGLGGTAFAEEYIDGREFNISLLTGGEEVAPCVCMPQVLPAAEIVFRDAAKWGDRPRIVNYDCKWNEDSFEYNYTERMFEFGEDDQSLLKRLAEIARRCWSVFGLHGYARVDFRVDANGEPWVLEVNTNPCLSPDAGFAFALERAPIAYSNAIERILNAAATARNPRHPAQSLQ